MDDNAWTLRAAVKRTASLGGMGLLAGAVAGWVALLGAEGMAARAGRVASLFWVLFLLLPATLLLWTWLVLLSPPEARRAPLVRAVIVSLATGLVGALLATLAFVAGSTQTLSIFGGINAGDFYQPLYAAIGWSTIWLLVAVVVVVALVSALVVCWRTR